MTSTDVTPTLDTKQNGDSRNKSGIKKTPVGVIVGISAIILLLVLIAVGTWIYIYRRKDNTLKGNIL